MRTVSTEQPSRKQAVLLNPYQFPIVVTLAIVSIVFTIWPEALEHSPIAFEERGVVHHIWHYSLMAATLICLYGMMSRKPWKLFAEMIGLSLIAAVLALNFVAQVAAGWGDFGQVNGLQLAVRSGLISGFLIRIGIIIFEPTIELPTNREPETSNAKRHEENARLFKRNIKRLKREHREES